MRRRLFQPLIAESIDAKLSSLIYNFMYDAFIPTTYLFHLIRSNPCIHLNLPRP